MLVCKRFRVLMSQARLLAFPSERVQKLVLSDCAALSDEGVLAIVNRCPLLQALNVSNCAGISDAALFYIAGRAFESESSGGAGTLRHVSTYNNLACVIVLFLRSVRIQLIAVACSTQHHDVLSPQAQRSFHRCAEAVSLPRQGELVC